MECIAQRRKQCRAEEHSGIPLAVTRRLISFSEPRPITKPASRSKPSVSRGRGEAVAAAAATERLW